MVHFFLFKESEVIQFFFFLNLVFFVLRNQEGSKQTFLLDLF